MTVLKAVHTGSAAPELVWRTLLDIEAFPSFMEGVQEVNLASDDGTTRASSWVVELKGSEIEWEQEDTVDAGQRRVDFRQLDGDLAQYEGHWRVEATEEGSALELHVEFDVGLPLVAEMMHPAVAKTLEGYQTAIMRRSEEVSDA